MGVVEVAVHQRLWRARSDVVGISGSLVLVVVEDDDALVAAVLFMGEKLGEIEKLGAALAAHVGVTNGRGDGGPRLGTCTKDRKEVLKCSQLFQSLLAVSLRYFSMLREPQNVITHDTRITNSNPLSNLARFLELLLKSQIDIFFHQKKRTQRYL